MYTGYFSYDNVTYDINTVNDETYFTTKNTVSTLLPNVDCFANLVRAWVYVPDQLLPSESGYLPNTFSIMNSNSWFPIKELKHWATCNNVIAFKIGEECELWLQFNTIDNLFTFILQECFIDTYKRHREYFLDDVKAYVKAISTKNNIGTVPELDNITPNITIIDSETYRAPEKMVKLITDKCTDAINNTPASRRVVNTQPLKGF